MARMHRLGTCEFATGQALGFLQQYDAGAAIQIPTRLDAVDLSCLLGFAAQRNDAVLVFRTLRSAFEQFVAASTRGAPRLPFADATALLREYAPYLPPELNAALRPTVSQAYEAVRPGPALD